MLAGPKVLGKLYVVDAIDMGYRLIPLLSAVERRGRVLMVFNKVINVEGLLDQLVTIGIRHPGVVLHAYMLRIHQSTEGFFKNMGIREGMEVRASRGLIVINKEIAIDFRKASIWVPDLYVKEPAAPNELKELLSIVLEVTRQYASDKGFTQLFKLLNINNVIDRQLYEGSNLMMRRALPVIEKLAKAIVNDEAHNLCNIVKELIGLGVGSTPSGDDFLSGLITTLYWFDRSYKLNLKILEELVKCIEKYSYRTSIISRQMFSRALVGELNEYVHLVLKGIIGANPSTVLDGIRRTVLLGETSGKDMLLGVLVASLAVLKHGINS